jgi:hypothetical protein
MTRVEVFVVRHGEREDEVAVRAFKEREEKIWNAKLRAQKQVHGKTVRTFKQALKLGLIQSMEPTDTLDPLLTARGHKQAQQSFSSLINALEGRKVAMFCSPLRRVIGTAMMVGAVAPNKTLSFPQPNRPDQEDNTEKESAIPITVLNSLGDFASSISHHGGARTLVPMGALRCASMTRNNGSPSSPFVQALASMPSHECAKDSRQGAVQFWVRHENNGQYAPMTPPFSPSDKRTKYTQNNEPFVYPDTIRQKTKTKCPPPPNPIYAVDEAVRLTIERGCNVCVIVAHREAIRDMAEQKCDYFGDRLPTSYCCIGSFLAEVEPGTAIHYSFHNVWDLERFGKRAIPRFSFPVLSDDTTLASSLMYLVPGEQMHRICVVRSQLTCGWLGSQIWLTAESRSSRPANPHQPRTILDLDIAEGHSSGWIKCIGEMRQKGLKLVGTTGWHLGDGRTHVLDIEILSGSRSQIRFSVSVST